MISFIDAFKAELEEEAKETRRMLLQVPDNKYDWVPHPKSMKMGVLAVHLADIPEMIAFALQKDKWDVATEDWPPRTFESNDQLLTFFDNSLEKARKALEEASEENLMDSWQLVAGDQVYLDIPKWEAVRHAFGQNAHHRAQLQVYLRLQDIPVPGPYGPSADETEGLINM
ncbi:DinB family protein [Jiulongibacter sp. NS-SX5]|uniref:DinB family protein n=1 Tax=Jiulongibacter sp. NS-SX5 TaxID=3463854 RepID=UPI004059FB93